MIRVAGTLAALLFLTFTGLAAAFDGIRLTLLGTAESSTHGEPAEPGLVVEAGDEVLLFDCGAGTLKRLQRAHVLVRELTAVFLTGLDPTHVAGCGELLAARQVAAEQPLLLWGPAGTVQAMQEWTAPPTADKLGSVHAYEIGENLVYDTDDVRVTAIVVDSAPRSPAYGYRVDRDRRAVALLAGARYSENLAHNARGAQVLVSEVAAAEGGQGPAEALVREVLANCTSPEDAGRILHAARPYLAVFSRVQLFGVSEEEVVRRTRRYYRGPLQIGRDLMIVEIQNEVQIRSTPSDGPRQ